MARSGATKHWIVWPTLFRSDLGFPPIWQFVTALHNPTVAAIFSSNSNSLDPCLSAWPSCVLATLSSEIVRRNETGVAIAAIRQIHECACPQIATAN
jgi:hypothetical protein